MAGVVDHKAQRERTLFAANDLDAADAIDLSLRVVDRDTIDELLSLADDEREAFALHALRIGVLALRQARGRLDADLIQREMQRMLSGLDGQLSVHAAQVQEKLAGSLKEYFDPASGRFHERVQQLVKPDGELEQLLRRQIGSEDSELCKTLLAHFGHESPLMKLLNPSDSAGLLQLLSAAVETKLAAQREHVLKEFSLDNKQGALARMIGELTDSHGKLTEALQRKIDAVIAEFSLDKEDSALSRLVRNVDSAQQTITQEFSLDSDDSALARLRGELVKMFKDHAETNASFQEEVKVALARMATRREESQRSTRHGLMFEDAVCQFLEFHSQQTGDIATRCGHTTGLIKNCKKGDCLVELGPETVAAGAKVVVEAKESADYTLSNACQEIETARENRGAQVGLFVFSKKTAPPEVENEKFFRRGNDLFVVWDGETMEDDAFLKIGLSVARALCVRVEKLSKSQSDDFQAIMRAVNEIEKQSQLLAEVTTSAETIKSGAEKVIDRVRISRKSLEREVAVLQEKIGQLRGSAAKADVIV